MNRNGNISAKERILLKAAKKAVEPLKLKEFRCPMCGGVASVGWKCGVLRAECHACGLRAKEKEGI